MNNTFSQVIIEAYKLPPDLREYFEPALCDDCYVCGMVAVFREVWRVLKPEATCWLNLGDSYFTCDRNDRNGLSSGKVSRKKEFNREGIANKYKHDIIKPKDLIGIPWRVAFALQADGWYLRSDIIWHKPNPMPESVRDRPTKSHEYIFLLAKQQRYYYDQEAILEPAAYDGRKDTMFKGATKSYDGVMPGGKPQSFAQNGHERWPKRLYPEGNNQSLHDYKHSGYFKEDGSELFRRDGDGKPARNRRSVWTVTTKPYKGAHFATYPPDLIEPCILAGCPPGGIVLDPFFGSGTTGEVAIKHNRRYIGLELNREYINLARKRIAGTAVMLPEAHT